MTTQPPSNTKFWIFTVAILLGSASGIAALLPLAQNYAKAEAQNLVQEGNKASGGEAEVDYRLATWLDSTNRAAYIGLARAQIANGRADEALATLNQAGEGSDTAQLKVRMLIELGRHIQAASEVTPLIQTGASQKDLILASLAYALAGQSENIEALMPRISSPEALQSIRRAQTSQFTLAAELFATGLLESASSVLEKQPVSFERNLILARIHHLRRTPLSLTQAVDLLNQAITIDPSSIEARQLLAQVYHYQENLTGAAQQEAFINKLKSGRL